MKKSSTEITIGFAVETIEKAVIKTSEQSEASLFWAILLIIMGTLLGISL